MTPAQLATLKAFASADQTAAALMSAGNDSGLSDWFNAAANPAYVIYRTQVQVSEVMLNGFDWTRVDNLSVGKARIWEWITRANPFGTFDPSKANIRAGVNETWKGTAADLAVRAAVYAHCTKSATRAERALAAGSGTAIDGNGDGPGVPEFEGAIDSGIASQIRTA